MKHVSVARAKNRLLALLREVESEPIEIWIDEKPAAVLISVASYRRISATERKHAVFAALDTMRSVGGLPAPRDVAYDDSYRGRGGHVRGISEA